MLSILQYAVEFCGSRIEFQIGEVDSGGPGQWLVGASTQGLIGGNRLKCSGCFVGLKIWILSQHGCLWMIWNVFWLLEQNPCRIMMGLSQKSFLDPQRATVKKTLSNSGPARPLRWGRNPSEKVHLCCFVGKPYLRLSSNLCWQSSEGSICVGKVSRYSLHPSTTKNVAQDVPRSSRLLPRCGGVAGLRLRWRWGEEMCYADKRKWCVQGVQPVLEGCELLWLRTEWR